MRATTALVIVMLGLVVAPTSTSAQPQHRIIAGGIAQDGFDITSAGPVEAADVLRNPYSSTEVAARSRPGLVGAFLDGSFASPGETRAIGPSVNAISRGELVFAGPTPTVTTSASIDFDGFLNFAIDPGALLASEIAVRFQLFAGPSFSELDVLIGQSTNTGVRVNNFSGLDITFAPAGVRIEGTGQTSDFTVPVGTPVEVILWLTLVSNQLASGALLGGASFTGDFFDTVSFATDSLVFNLPAGFSVNGAGIVNNRFAIDQVPPGTVPEPATVLLLAIAIAALLWVKLRRARGAFTLRC